MEDLTHQTSAGNQLESEQASANAPESTTRRERRPVKETSLDLAAFFGLVALIAGTPLFFVPAIGLPLSAAKLAFFGVGVSAVLFLWLLARMRDGTLTFPNTGILAGLLALPAVTLVSAVFSKSPDVSLFGRGLAVDSLFFMVLFVMFAFLVSVYFRSKVRIGMFFGALFASAVVLYVYHIIRFLFGPDTLSFGIFLSSVATPIGGWYNLAIFSGLIALLALAAQNTVPMGRSMKMFSLVLYAVSLIFLLLIDFFIVWVLLATASIFLFARSMMRMVSHGRDEADEIEGEIPGRFPALPLFTFLVSLFFLLAPFLGGNPVTSTIQSVIRLDPIQEVRPSWVSTFKVAKETASEGVDTLVLGSGPGTFSTQWSLYKPEGIRPTLWWNVNFERGVGLVPTFMTTTGVLGVLAWLGFFGLIFFAGLRGLSAAKKKNDGGAEWIFLLIVMELYLWAVAIWYVPSVPIIVLAFAGAGLLSAALLAQGVVTPKVFRFLKDPRVGFAAVLFLILALAVSIFLGYMVVQKYRAVDSYYDGLVASQVRGDLAAAEASVANALGYDEEDTYYRALAELQIAKMRTLLTQDTGRAEEELLQLIQRIFTDGLRFARSAVDFDEHNHSNWIALGDVYAFFVSLKVQDAYENAADAYQKALELSPGNPFIYLKFAQLEISEGDTSAAEEYISQALATKSNYTEAYVLHSGILQDTGRRREAIRALESASVIAGTNPELWFRLGYLKYTAEDYAGAVQAFERAVILNPVFANAKYFLGLSYERLDRKDDALAQFNDVLRLNPGNQEVEQIIANIKAGRDPFSGGAGEPSLVDAVPDEGEAAEDLDVETLE